MDITQRLIELDPTLVLHNEGDWENPVDHNKPGFTSFNNAGIETETGEFLYAMVRILKPDWVLETGTHWGVGASYMGMALKDNHNGKLDTVEFLPEIHAKAQKRIRDLGLTEQVRCHLGDVAKFDPYQNSVGFGGSQYKFILLDTEPQTRFAELLKFYPYLAPGGFVFIHDLHQHMHQIANDEHGFAWPYGRLPDQIRRLVNRDELRPFHFETPRGLTGFYKVHPNDYQWL